MLSDGHIYHTTDRCTTKDSTRLAITSFDFLNRNNSIGINSNEIYSTNYGWKTFSKLFNLTNVEGNNLIIQNKTVLHQNYPNPFNPSTTIKYNIPAGVKSKK